MSKTLKLQIITNLQDRLSAPLARIRGASGQSSKSIKELRDKLKGLEQTQKQVGEFRNLTRGLSETSAKMRDAQSRVNALASQMKATQQPSAKLRREFQQAVKVSSDLKQQHSEQAQRLQTLRSRLSTTGVSTKNLSHDERGLRSEIARTNDQLEAQRKKLGEVAQQQRKLGEARDKLQKTQALAGSMAASGAAAMATGSGVLYGGYKFLSKGIEFDESMSKVQSLTRLDKNSKEMEKLRDQAKDLGAKTMFSATEAAQGQAFLGMAGFKPQDILDAMPGLLDMAKAGGNELSEAADIASNILTGFNLQATEMERVGDVLVGAFTRSNTDLAMLGETMKYAAPIASSLGQDIETVAAMAGKLGDAGIQGGMAGTALRSIMNRMSAPPAAAAKAMDALGVNAQDAAGNLRPMPELLTEIYEKTKSMGDAQRAGLLKGIAGEEAVSAMQVLVRQAGMGELQGFIETLKNAQGEASQTAKVMADNMVGDLDELSSAWEDLGIQLQEQQDGSMRSLTQMFTGILSYVGGWIKENPVLTATLVKLVAIVAALVAVGGALTLGLASIIGPLAVTRYGMTLLGVKGAGLKAAFVGLGKTVAMVGRIFLSNPIVMIAVAIAGAAYLIWRYWEPIKAFFSNLWASITEIFFETVDALSSILQAGFEWAVSVAKAIWEPIQAFFSELWLDVRTAFSGGLLSIAELIVNWSPLGLFYKAFAAVMDYLGVELPGKFSEFGGMLMTGLVNGIKGMASAVKDSVVEVAEGAMSWFKGVLGIESPSRVFMGYGENVSEGAAIGITQKQGQVMKTVQALVAGVMTAGAGLAFANDGAGFVGADAFKFDTRPAIQSTSGTYQPSSISNKQLAVGGDKYEFNIHAAPGMSPTDIASAVRREIERIEREKAARRRSSLSDI